MNTLEAAQRSLNDFLFWAGIWSLGGGLVMYGEHDWPGAIAILGVNGAIMAGIWLKYQEAFERAILRHGLRTSDPATATANVALVTKQVSVFYA